ncbi:MAG: MFS transporter [Candidatus Angelobacter sp. Gp1-AA117]|nr:MAG: MFS transporter [Candidatus Angelobacter sp. Gp1-AA117]
MSAVTTPRATKPMENPAQAQAVPTYSTLAPLREPLFRSLWIAAVISYTGSWMQNIATGWLMTSLTSSPMYVALVQVALSLPVFLIAVPAGALADLVDRRKFLLLTQSSMVAAATVLGILTVTHVVTPQLLLVFTFLLGVGAVMNDPAWQALTPDLVPTTTLPAAVALNSAGFNIARAVGPAIGGLVIAAAGSGVTFLLNAISFFGVILFLYRWKPSEREVPQVVSTIGGAIRVGLHYARQNRQMQAVLLRTLAFSLFASAFWALLPLIASDFGASGYGAMLAFFGLGALLGAVVLSRMRRKFSPDRTVVIATLIFAGALFGLVRSQGLALSSLYAAAAGLAWITALATLNLVAQTCAPPWVRARMISMYVFVLQAGLAIGSTVWGILATHRGLTFAVTAAAIALCCGLPVGLWYRLQPERVSV